jgi:hypothetical protein
MAMEEDIDVYKESDNLSVKILDTLRGDSAYTKS